MNKVIKISNPSTICARRKKVEREIKIAQHKAQECRFNNFIKSVAHSMRPTKSILKVNSLDAPVQISDQVLLYKGKLDMNDSVWAPWSINYKA